MPQYYQFLTEKLAPGRHQFRLKQIDLDGSFTFSDALEVNVTIPGTFELSELFPNPFNPATSFTLAVVQEQPVQIEVIVARGRSVRTLFDGLFLRTKSTVFSSTARSIEWNLLRALDESEFYGHA